MNILCLSSFDEVKLGKSLQSSSFNVKVLWASLVAQWLRICLLMQGTRVRALVWEDPTCTEQLGP